MRLAVGSITVDNLEFGPSTTLRGRTLVVNRDEIRRVVLEDPHFAEVEIHVARPGESTRIIHAMDVVEPRWKVAGPGGVFPGLVSAPAAAGAGTTIRLAGVAVVEAGEPVPGEPTHFREQVVDMSGPGAEYSPFGQTLNLVLEFQPNLALFPAQTGHVKDVSGGTAAAADYQRAVLAAGPRVAAHLARAVQDAPADDVETFELPACDPDLPRVVCLYQSYRHILYGLPISLPLGTLLHPNEYFDGALIGWRHSRCTYWDQNHATMQQLCRRHGRDLNFLGSILFGGITPERTDKERLATAVAKFAGMLRAQAAVVLGINGSNYAVDAMWVVQLCEQLGIKTVLVYPDVGDGRDDPGFIFAVPEADTIVCTGSQEQRVSLPRVGKVIGGERLIDSDDAAAGEITVPMRLLHSSLGMQGYNRLSTRFQ
jgi:glycine reductase